VRARDRSADRVASSFGERQTVIEIRIPKLGMEMTEGTLSSWLVDDGEAVNQDQPIYLLETDKVENEIPAPIGGTVRHVGTAGETYPVGEIIATID
jgi:pyruvate/2-oxoglutarate dehydrogenase complex dihydrolipoamide acyltransferase (E2) component